MRSNPYPLGVMLITQIFPDCGYKEKYKDLAEERKKLKEKSKARKDADDFSLIFEKACDEVRKGGYVYDQNEN